MTGSNIVDVAIIGGGHNGLTCAAYLAAAGLDVLVLEKNDDVGGAALTEEFHPGYRNSVAAYTVSLLNPKVMADLNLAAHGLRIVKRPVANFWPVDETRYLLMRGDMHSRQAAIAKFSRSDAERLLAFEETLTRAGNVLRDLVLRTPPNAGGGVLEILKGASVGRRIIGLDLHDKRVLLDLFTKSAAEFLDAWFENDVVKGAFAFDSIVGNYAAPSTPGTAYVLLHHCFGEVNGMRGAWGHAIGGMGAITQAMAKAARARHARIRTGACVVRLLTNNGTTRGVVLDTGEEIRARAVAANVPPKLLFRDLVPEGAVTQELQARFTQITSGSGSFRMNVALSELPNFVCRPGKEQQDHHGAGIIVGPTLEYLERAYFDARLEGWSREPVIEMVIPSTLDSSLAPKGAHVASLFIQHVAPHLPGSRTWEDANEAVAFADLVIETVNKYAPNFKAAVTAKQVLSPLDMERRFGMIDGDIFHGALSLNQLFSARPQLGFADYRMPVDGLYLCGSGAHPGGGVTGLPGHNAAREIIRDFKSWSRFGRR